MASKLSDDDIGIFLAKSHGHLATLMQDGSPHVAPVWLDHRDGRVWVNTAEGRVKLANVRRDHRVAISVEALDGSDTGVLIRGRVVEITHDGAKDHIDFLSEKYRGVAYQFHDPEHPRVLLKIEPEHVAYL